jgi:hypothetical protein
MKRYFILVVLSLFLLASCELLSPNYDYEINLLNIALDYQNTDISSLYGTLNDSKELEKTIRLICSEQEINYTNFSYHQEGIKHDSATVNDLNYPSKTNILSALEKLSTISHDNSINIIYYSGHANQNGSWLLATTDTLSTEYGTSFSSNGLVNENQLLSVDEIYNTLIDVKGKTVIIVDACYSGNFYKDSAYSLSDEEFNFIDAYNKFISTNEETNDIYILVATEKDNKSYEPSSLYNSRIHGYFTKALLEGLGWCDGEKGVLSTTIDENYIDEDGIQGELSNGVPPAAKNNIVSIDSLVSYIKSNQEIAQNSNNYEVYHQYPQVSGGRFDLVLFRY